MTTGIDIEFYQPHDEKNKKKGKLYIDEDGKDYFEFNGTLANMFDTLKVVFAKEIDSGEKYTLINSSFRQLTSNYVRFVINEFYKGDFIDKVLEASCIGAEARITGLTNWINHPRIKPEVSFSSSEQSKVVIDGFFAVTFPITKHIEMELCEFCGEVYGRNETILRNVSTIKFISAKPVSRLELYKNIIGFLRLLSIFTDDLPKLTSLDFTFSNGKTLEHLTTKKLNKIDENEALVSYKELEPYWASAIGIFYKNRDKFLSVLNLLTASIENSTAEISFLNITTAFEVFHKYFYEANNDAIRQTLSLELVEAGIINRVPKKWDQIIRYHHLFKLSAGIAFFKENFLNPNNTIALIRDSRNYYTHYTATENEIWTPNRLLYANKALRQLLKVVILKELQIPNELINKLLNNRAGIFYHDYESNEYSLNYLMK